jgi:hypothetical protein
VKNIRVLASVLLLLFISGQTVRLADGSAAGETRYTVLMMGNKAGYESSIANPAGGSRLYYEFNDRGRGPKITEDIVVDKDGIPSTTHNAGIDYYKAPVEEYFSLSSGNASWKNRAEAGRQQRSGGAAFYVSISGVPEETAILARALLVAPGGKLPLLPAGEAAIEKRREMKVEVRGQSRTIVQYAITGLDFTPIPIWLEPDGKFFALVSGSWFAVVPEGSEALAETLAKARMNSTTSALRLWQEHSRTSLLTGSLSCTLPFSIAKRQRCTGITQSSSLETKSPRSAKRTRLACLPRLR